jgi:hypothetical protein
METKILDTSCISWLTIRACQLWTCGDWVYNSLMHTGAKRTVYKHKSDFTMNFLRCYYFNIFVSLEMINIKFSRFMMGSL